MESVNEVTQPLGRLVESSIPDSDYIAVGGVSHIC